MSADVWRGNVYIWNVVYVIFSTLITMWTMNLPFHLHSLYVYAKIFVSIISTAYIAYWMTNIWLYQTKNVLIAIKNHNEACCVSYVLKSK